jgi:hypothetical protein
MKPWQPSSDYVKPDVGWSVAATEDDITWIADDAVALAGPTELSSARCKQDEALKAMPLVLSRQTSLPPYS